MLYQNRPQSPAPPRTPPSPAHPSSCAGSNPSSSVSNHSATRSRRIEGATRSGPPPTLMAQSSRPRDDNSATKEICVPELGRVSRPKFTPNLLPVTAPSASTRVTSSAPALHKTAIGLSAGVPCNIPSILMSSSTSGQCTQTPSPINFQWSRWTGVASDSRHDQARGTLTVRPSTR